MRTGSKCNSLAIYIIRASVTHTLGRQKGGQSAKLTPSLLLHISTVWRLGLSFRNKSGLRLPYGLGLVFGYMVRVRITVSVRVRVCLGIGIVLGLVLGSLG